MGSGDGQQWHSVGDLYSSRVTVQKIKSQLNTKFTSTEQLQHIHKSFSRKARGLVIRKNYAFLHENARLKQRTKKKRKDF